MLHRHQIKAARELLGWSQQDCAKHAGIGVDTLKRLEVGNGQPRRATLDAVLSALQKAGIRSGERGNVLREPPTGGVFPRG